MDLIGRQQIVSKKEFQEDSRLTTRPAIVKGRCKRCGSAINQECFLPIGSYYCAACLRFGRITTNDLLLTQSEGPNQCRKVDFTWKGTLTDPQKVVANQVLVNYLQRQHSMVWAVAEYS